MLKLHRNLSKNTQPIYRFVNNHSVDFDGVDGFIQLGEPLSYTSHTISAWIKVGDSDASKTIIDARDANDDGIRIFLTSAEVVTYQLNTSDINSGSAISVNEWHHIVATYDGATQKLYIDGSLVDSTATEQEISTTTNAEIGSRNFSDRANEFLGKIDELAIWNRALDEEEVTKIYRKKFGANLIQNGRFDELGSELATNGDFSTGGAVTNSSWSLGFRTPDSGISIENGVLNLVNEDNSDFDGRVNFTNGSNAALTITSGKTFVLEYEILENTNSSIFGVFNGSTYIYLTNTVGTHKAYYVAAGTNAWVRNGGNNSTIKLGKLSLKQVDPNDRWTFGGSPTAWSYGDSKVIANSASGTFCTQAGILTTGKTYKVTFTVQNITQGRVRFRSSGVNGTTRSANGTYTELITVAGTGFSIQGLTDAGGFTGEVTNIMAEEQKYVASNLILNSIPYSSSNLKNYYRMGDGILDTHPLICDMVAPSLGNNVYDNNITQAINGGGFTNNSDGTFTVTGSGSPNTAVGVRDLNAEYLTPGKIYKWSVTGDNITLAVYNSSFGLVASGTSPLYLQGLELSGTPTTRLYISPSNGESATYSEVSIKEVNGVPGFMTNMTTADITNDVPS